MGIVAEPITPAGKDIQYRQQISPSYVSGSFLGDDTDNHQFSVDARGKGSFSIEVNNLPNQIVTAIVYGKQVDGLLQSIGTFTVAAASKGYEIVADPFPFYLIDLSYTVAPNDVPLKTCSLYINLVS